MVDPRLNILKNIGDALADFTEGLASAVGGIASDARRDYLMGKIAREEATTTDPERQCYFGRKYESGQAEGNDYNNGQDYEKAFGWFQKAANQGHTEAQFRLGYLYQSGLGTVRDYEKARFWYQQAAAKGNTSAQFYLGLIYGNGLGVIQDFSESQLWFQNAADQGDECANDLLIILYSKGVSAWIKELSKWVG